MALGLLLAIDHYGKKLRKWRKARRSRRVAGGAVDRRGRLPYHRACRRWCRSRRGIGGSQFSYELFGRKLGFRFGRVVNWRHDATNLIASDHSRACLQGNSGAPVTRLSLVGNYRIVGDVGHYGPPLRQTRACDAAMSTAARAQCRASLAHAFSRRGRHHRSGERSGHGRGAQGDVSVRPVNPIERAPLRDRQPRRASCRFSD
jgi:hypothetical protein